MEKSFFLLITVLFLAVFGFVSIAAAAANGTDNNINWSISTSPASPRVGERFDLAVSSSIYGGIVDNPDRMQYIMANYGTQPGFYDECHNQVVCSAEGWSFKMLSSQAQITVEFKSKQNYFSTNYTVTAPPPPQQQPAGGGTIEIQNPLVSLSFDALIKKLIDWLFNIALVLAPLMFIFAAFKFVTSEGKPESVQQAKDLIWWTIVGIVIILLAKGLISLLKDILGVAP